MQIRKPNFFVIGSPNAGSTSLWELLSQHPDIFMPAQKEPRFFSRFDSALHWDQYLSLFVDAGDRPCIGEASINYIETHVFPGTHFRLHSFAPQARLILIVREPIGRLESCWRQAQESGHWYKRFYTEELMPLDFNRAIFEYPHFLDTCRYWELLKPYRQVFDDRQICVVFFEDFVRSPEKTMFRLFEFLEVDAEFAECYNKVEQRNAGFKKTMWDPRYQRLLKAAANPDMPSLFLTLCQKALRRWGNRVPVTAPEWNEGVKEKVLEELREDHRQLLEWAGKRSDFWHHTY